jgi:DNA polymerase-1
MSKELLSSRWVGFIFRAYHALPPLSRADGTPVECGDGILQYVIKTDLDPSDAHIAVIFDAARKNFRNEYLSRI